jgi:hypothetical protein
MDQERRLGPSRALVQASSDTDIVLVKNVRLISAILDRIPHHARTIVVRDKICRMRDRAEP